MSTAGRPSQVLSAITALLATLALTACPNLPPPDKLDFATDPRILRGNYSGTVDTRKAPFFMALAGDASLLAASWPGSIQLWDLGSMEPTVSISIPSGSDDVLGGLSVDGSGSSVAGLLNGALHVWNAQNGDLVSRFDPRSRLGSCRYCGAYQLALTSAGDLVAVAGQSPKVLLIEADTGRVVHELEGAGERVDLVAFSSDGALLASASRLSDSRYALRVWDVGSFDVVFELEGTVSHHRAPRFAFSADGRRLAVGSETKLEVFDLAGGVTTLPLDGPTSPWFWTLSPDGTQAALGQAGEPEQVLAIVDLATGHTLAYFEDTQRGRPVWSADGSLLVAGSMVVDANDFEVLRDFVIGKLHELELVATPQYVDPRRYAVSGTVRIDGGEDIELSGTVQGNESQRYVQPHARLPSPATLEIELLGHPWRFYGHQDHDYFYPDPVEDGSWWGNMSDSSLEDDHSWNPFRLWRVQ